MDANQLLKDMGRRIHNQRKLLGLTQEQLAEEMDVTSQTISYAEQGRKALRPENIIKICDALNMSADFLLTGKSYTEHEDTIYQNLSQLTPEQLIYVDMIINSCIGLCNLNRKPNPPL